MIEKYSGKKVIKAGEQFLSDDIFSDETSLNTAINILSYWRFSHEVALDNALDLLEAMSLDVDKKAIFAKSLKNTGLISKRCLFLFGYCWKMPCVILMILPSHSLVDNKV